MTKKVLSIIAIFSLLFFALQINVYAASIPLESVTVDVSEDTIAPGEEVTVTINFGTELGAYTFDIAYDNNLFEYVSSEGGTENDDGTRVRVTFYDSTGGSNPRSNMSVTFKAKDNIVTTNPTNFSITAEGLANSDASQEYDDITTAITKDVTVEPNYVDYEISLDYSGNIIVDEEKEMQLVTESSMGRYYDHVKLTIEVVSKPSDNATVELTAITSESQEVDLIQDGWGDPDGYELGGQNVRQELNITGVFSEAGEYQLKVTLLDKDDSDSVIASKDITLNVQTVTVEDDNTQEDNETVEDTTDNENATDNTTTEDDLPESLPKTGMTQYAYIITIITVLGAGYISLKNNKK